MLSCLISARLIQSSCHHEGPASLQLSGVWLAPSLHEGAEVSLKIKPEMSEISQADVVDCTCIKYVCVCVYDIY